MGTTSPPSRFRRSWSRRRKRRRRRRRGAFSSQGRGRAQSLGVRRGPWSQSFWPIPGYQVQFEGAPLPSTVRSRPVAQTMESRMQSRRFAARRSPLRLWPLLRRSALQARHRRSLRRCLWPPADPATRPRTACPAPRPSPQQPSPGNSEPPSPSLSCLAASDFGNLVNGDF